MYYFLVAVTIEYMGRLGSTADYSHTFNRLVRADDALTARRAAIINENDVLDEDMIDKVCADNGYEYLNNECMELAEKINNEEFEKGLINRRFWVEDERLTYETAEPVKLQTVDAKVNGVTHAVRVPESTHLLMTRQELIDAQKLPTDSNKLYRFTINLYIGGGLSQTDKDFDVYQSGATKEDAEHKAMMQVCQETEESDTLERLDENGKWDTCDESGAYTLTDWCDMLEAEVSIDGKEYIVFIPDHRFGLVDIATLTYWG